MSALTDTHHRRALAFALALVLINSHTLAGYCLLNRLASTNSGNAMIALATLCNLLYKEIDKTFTLFAAASPL